MGPQGLGLPAHMRAQRTARVSRAYRGWRFQRLTYSMLVRYETLHLSRPPVEPPALSAVASQPSMCPRTLPDASDGRRDEAAFASQGPLQEGVLPRFRYRG